MKSSKWYKFLTGEAEAKADDIRAEIQAMDAEIEEKKQVIKDLKTDRRAAGIKILGTGGSSTRLDEIQEQIQALWRDVDFLKSAKADLEKKLTITVDNEQRKMADEITLQIQDLTQQQVTTRAEAIEAVAKSDALLFLSNGRHMIESTSALYMRKAERARHLEIFNEIVAGRSPLRAQIRALMEKREALVKTMGLRSPLKDACSEP